MDEGRSGATRMRWERMCAIIPWLTGMHEESERTERERASVRACLRALRSRATKTFDLLHMKRTMSEPQVLRWNAMAGSHLVMLASVFDISS